MGETKNVGGVDAVGITYYNTSGTYNTAVISSLGYVTDHNGWSDYLYNPSHGNGRYGVAFDFQDKMRVQKVGGLGPSPDDFTYYGSGFSASITYDSNFINYNGYARTMYAHTWDTTTINSIGFSGGGGQYGVNISWSSSSNRFVVFNGSDTVFQKNGFRRGRLAPPFHTTWSAEPRWSHFQPSCFQTKSGGHYYCFNIHPRFTVLNDHLPMG